MAIKVRVTGTVQGVGFRPFVYKMAKELHLRGFVRNLGGEVEIALDGPQQSLDEFLLRLRQDAPALAVIDSMQVEPDCQPEQYGEFLILHSSQAVSAFQTVPPDTATCQPCLVDMSSADNRRFKYPFTNCTDCGPRFTIIKELPYDRRATTMAGFKMCAPCRAEYEHPEDRRFHAQPNACWACGPQIWFAEKGMSTPTARRSPEEQLSDLDRFVMLLDDGGIGALKGLGGFHLCCDAESDEAVLAMRLRKKRDEKPFAVMFNNLAQAARYVRIDEAASQLLTGPRRPVVLLPKHGQQLSDQVAPGLSVLGVMLPYTPLHHLLLEQCDQPLVMTSGNLCDEPICMENEEASRRLNDIADGFLFHDRDIKTRFDDSVLKADRASTIFIRRSRGYAPQAVSLPGKVNGCLLAVGAELKNTFCFGKESHAYVSQHIGDLDDVAAHEFFHHTLETFSTLFGLEAEGIIHDLHPDYLSTKAALELARRRNIPSIAVQHHHAHVVSCMITNGITEPVIGVALDGTGYGDDGTVWGGEILVANTEGYQRFGHFAQVPMPGVEAAIRQPPRMLAAYASTIESPFLERRLQEILAPHALEIIRQQLDKNFNCALTSSCGRLFDAVAALLGICTAPSFEGQAAMQVEAIARGGIPALQLTGGTSRCIDGALIIAGLSEMLAAGADPATVASTFHATVAAEVTRICRLASQEHGVKKVCLSGGVLQNSLLSELLQHNLQEAGLQAFIPRDLPPNDGGISLGQLIIGAAKSGKWRVH